MTDSGIPRRPVVIFGFGMFGLGLAVGGFGAYVNELVARGIDPGTAGFGSTLFLFGQFAAVLPADVLSRRWSIRYVALGGLLLGALGVALGGILSLEVHLLSRLLLGLGSGVIFLTIMKYAGRRAEGTTVARLQGLLGAFFTLGLAVGIAAMPWAVEQFGPVSPSVVASLPLFGSALLAPSVRPVRTASVVPLRAYLTPFGNAFGISLGLANAASFGLLIVATTWYTDIVSAEQALPAGLVLTGFAIATFVGRTGSGWLTVFTTESRAVGGSLLFLAATLALVAVALSVESNLLLSTALVLTGLGFGLPFGSLFSLAFASLKSDAGVLLVGMTALGNAAALAYPWLIGWLLVATDSYVAGFVVMALSVLAVTLLWQRAVVAPAA